MEEGGEDGFAFWPLEVRENGEYPFLPITLKKNIDEEGSESSSPPAPATATIEVRWRKGRGSEGSDINN